MSGASELIYEHRGETCTVPCRVIDLHGGRAEHRELQLVLQDGAIAELRPADSQPEVFVTAGFINCHVHWLMDAGTGPLSTLATDVAGRPDDKAEQAIAAARAMLRKGVTFACDKGPAGTCGAPVYRSFLRAMAGGEAMTNTIFSTWALMPDGGFGAPYGRTIHTTQEMELALLELEATGAGAVKLIPESAYGEASPHYRFLFPEEAMLAARQTARDKGWVFAVHAKGLETLGRCAEMAVDCVEHGVEADPEILRSFQERSVFLGPTLDGLLCRLEHARQLGAEKMLQSTTYDWDQVCRMVRNAATLNDGQPFTNMLFSSDAGSFATPYASLRELALMRTLGWQPAAVLEAATVNGARCLKQPNRGSVERGKRADLIFWSSDPLALSVEEWQHLDRYMVAVALNGSIVE